MRSLYLSVVVAGVAVALAGGVGARAQSWPAATKPQRDFTAPHDSRLEVPTQFKERDPAKQLRFADAAVHQRVYWAAATPAQAQILTGPAKPCYTMRSYNFEPSDAANGITRLGGVSDCQQRKTYSLQEIVVPAYTEVTR